MAPTDHDQGWPEALGRAVREAAPDVPDFTTAEQVGLWQQVEATGTSPAPRRTRWKVLAAGLVAAGLVGVAGAAAGNVFSAHTGQGPVDAEDAELGGPGETLNPEASDFPAVLDEVTADIGFPSAEARASSLSWEVESLVPTPSEEPSFVSTGAVRLWMSGHALCSWSNVWAGALRTGDTVAEGEAADVILGARAWTSITDTDPDLSGESEFHWLPALEQAVRSDDLAAAEAALGSTGSCMPGLAPQLGLGKRW